MYTKEELEAMEIPQLMGIAKELGVSVSQDSALEDVVYAIIDKAAENSAAGQSEDAPKRKGTIDNAFKELINQVKQEISLRRQAEDNAKTQSEISRKQQRLAALRANTAGGNQVEIAKLQKEIAESQQSYGRTLEDQLMDTLSRQGDEAAKQRERQIALLQAQRDIAQKTGLDAAKIDEWITNPKKHEQEIRETLFSKEGYNALTKPERDVVDAGINDKIANFKEIPGKIDTVQSAINGTSNSVTSSIGSLQDALSDLAKAIQGMLADQERQEKIETTQEQLDLKGKSKAELEQALDKAIHDQTQAKTKKDTRHDAYEKALNEYDVAKKESDSSYSNKQQLQSEYNDLLKKVKGAATEKDRVHFQSLASDKYKDLQDARKEYDLKHEEALNKKRIMNTKKNDYDLAYNEYHQATNAVNQIKAALASINEEISALQTDLKDLESTGYASGGLNTSTGPTWLHGTPSKPELVLNPADTQNFLALRDVLSKATKSTSSTNMSYGNATYEININVDHLSNDYDVDRVAERVKKIIVKDSGYRNVTQVRNFR